MRRAWLDACPGERRGVITLDGRPERLLIERDGDPEATRLCARSVARVRTVEPALRSAFLELADGGEALAPAAGLSDGAAVEVELTAEPRRGKLALARVLGPAEGPPRLLAPGPAVAKRLLAWAGGGEIVRGEAARDAADVAEEAALAVEHVLPGGGSLAIERTRALIAVDVDVGGGGGRGDAGRALRRVNLAALAETARLLRLKGLAGLIAVDLAGGAQGAEPLLAAAREAFTPDQPGVAFGPLSRFGLLQLVKPWRETPVADRLLDDNGRCTPRTIASDVVRALERSGRADPGGRFEALCPPAVARMATPLVAVLGPRFSVREGVGAAASPPDIRRL